MTDNNSLERIVPDELKDEFGLASLKLHEERYRFAGKNISAGRILDIACGSGYGSNLLVNEFSESITELVGIDNSKEAISYAHQRYSHQKIKFIQNDAINFSYTQKFDSIVSLETIEHLQNPDAFIQNLYQLLKPAGRLIISAPVTFSTDINPYHLHDFTQKNFRLLLKAHGFKEINSSLQIQPISIKDIRDKKKGQRSSGMRKNLFSYYLLNPRSFFLRTKSLIRHGLTNKYLVLCLKKNN